MDEPPYDDEFPLDIDSLDKYLKQTPAVIERQKARTANMLAVVLIAGVISSLPLHLLSLSIVPDNAEAITLVFDKWYALVSPLAGAAVGAYYASRQRP